MLTDRPCLGYEVKMPQSSLSPLPTPPHLPTSSVQWRWLSYESIFSTMRESCGAATIAWHPTNQLHWYVGRQFCGLLLCVFCTIVGWLSPSANLTSLKPRSHIEYCTRSAACCSIFSSWGRCVEVRQDSCACVDFPTHL